MYNVLANKPLRTYDIVILLIYRATTKIGYVHIIHTCIKMLISVSG